MILKNFLKIKIVASLCCIFFLFGSQQLIPQAGVQGTQSHVIKYMSVSGLRSWFSNFGAEGEYFRRDRSTYVAQDQIDGLLYTGEYNNRMKGIKISKGLWIGTTNFDDPVTHITYSHKVVSCGPAAVYSGTEIIADENVGNIGIEMIGKFNHPTVLVDNNNSTALDFEDDVDVEDPTLLPDRMLINQFHTSIGVTVTRKILGFSQQYNDNYYIYEYTLKNTGIIDGTGEQKLNKTLTGVIFYLASRYSFAGESYTGTGRGDWFPAASSWGRNTILDVVGQDEIHTLPAPNNFRASFGYYGPCSTTLFGSPVSDLGLPGPNAQNVWILAGTQFGGMVVLHADTGPDNTADDRSQPFTTSFQGADATTNLTNTAGGQYVESRMSQKYTNFMASGHPSQTMAEQVGKDPLTGQPTAYANTFGSDPGGYLMGQGFGPYTLAAGDSVRIVIAEAIASISRTKNLEVARNWFQNNTSQFILPDGSSTTDRDVYKNSWVFSGKDSLFQTFRRAIDNYNRNYAIPQPPPPPDNFNVTSGGDRIKLSWSNSAESSPNFNGYIVFRAEGRFDTSFTKIFECNKSNVVNSFDDKTALRGFNYYYYVQTKDDGSTNDVEPGVPLVSSRFYTMTSNPAFLTRPAGMALTSSASSATYSGDGSITDFILPRSVSDSTGTVVSSISVTVNGVLQIPASYTVIRDTLRFLKAPIGSVQAEISDPTGSRRYDLSDIRIVPNPYNIKARNIQFGETDPTTSDRLAFYNLPPVCRIKIYTETGDLIETIEHNNGSGDDYWHSLTSSRQLVVSGLYIAYFEVTEDYQDENTGELLYRKGDHTFKKFVIIR